MKLKKIFSTFLMLFLSSALLITVWADTKDQLNKALEKKQQINESIKTEETKKKEVEAQHQRIEDQMKMLTAEIEKISLSLDELNAKKAQIDKELRQALEQEKMQTEVLKTRLRVIYEDGTLSYFNILLSSESIFDFFYNLEVLRQISQHDNNMLTKIKETKELIVAKEAELSGVIAQEESKKAEKETVEAALKSESDKKVAYMKELENNIEEFKRKAEEAKREEDALRAEIARQAARQSGANVPLKYSGGKFTWPAPGFYTITDEFGNRTHPVTKIYKLHTGMDIGVPTGNDVVAAADGVVVISGFNTAYGNYISINHGGGIVTLYAHNSRLLVSSGTNVKRGQVIAKSGNTGWSTGPHLHFEVIENGKPVNPRNYFK